MIQYKLVNGKQVKLTQEEIDARQIESTAWEAERLRYEREESYKDKRRMEYPAIGDQLDAMLKYFENTDVSNIPELEAVVTNWKNTKLKYPKVQS